MVGTEALKPWNVMKIFFRVSVFCGIVLTEVNLHGTCNTLFL